MSTPDHEWIAFAGTTRIASGPPQETVARAKEWHDCHAEPSVLIFDARTGATIGIDLSIEPAHLGRIVTHLTKPQSATDPAVAHTEDVRLLPRHWDWLRTQPGGPSAALRRLVEHAMRASAEADRQRTARDAAYRFMTALAGDAPRYEDALRALYANDRARLSALIAEWPHDVRHLILSLIPNTAAKM